MRPTWVEISSAALLNNYAVLARQAQQVDAGLMPVVKADAYGHGCAKCGRLLAERAGAEWLVISNVEEGVLLRRALEAGAGGVFLSAGDERGAEDFAAGARAGGPEILVLGSVWRDEADAVIEHGLTVVVWEPYQISLLAEAAERRAVEVRVHVEVDTGMSRQGVDAAHLGEVLKQIAKCGQLRLDGVLTHYAAPDEPEHELNDLQTERFLAALDEVWASGARPRWVHAGQSAVCARPALMKRLREKIGAAPGGARLMLRPGLALYGYLLPERLQPSGRGAPELAKELKPAFAWKTRITDLRDVQPGTPAGYNATWVAEREAKLALLPVGYGDGFDRRLGGGEWSVLVRGRRAAVVGRVSMDLIVVDVTHVAGVEIGDEVVLIGEQGGVRISAELMADALDTIVYEVLCGVGARVRREMVA
jgi:alanine racemase